MFAKSNFNSSHEVQIYVCISWGIFGSVKYLSRSIFKCADIVGRSMSEFLFNNLSVNWMQIHTGISRYFPHTQRTYNLFPTHEMKMEKSLYARFRLE